MVDNIRVKTLNYGRIFKTVHVGAFILQNSVYWVQNSDTQALSDKGDKLAVALDLLGKRLSCPTQPEMEMQHYL